MTKIRRLNLAKIQESKIELVNMILNCNMQPLLTDDEKLLLKEMVEYVAVDHVGKFQQRYNTLQRYYYMASGILYENSFRQIEYEEPHDYSMFDGNIPPF